MQISKKALALALVVLGLIACCVHAGQPPAPGGMELWVRADSFTAAISVNSWPDTSGMNNHAIQTSSTFQPQVVLNAANSLPLIRFDGVDDLLNLTLRRTNIRTAFVVARSAVASQDYTPILGDTQAGGTLDYCSGGTPEGQGTRLFSSVYSAPSIRTTGSVFLNGVLVAATAVNRPSSLALISVAASANTTVGTISTDRAIAGRSWTGDYAEVILYNRALSAAERQQTENYLMTKWGIVAPIGVADTVTTTEDTTLVTDVLANDYISPLFQVQITVAPANGTATVLSNNVVQYTPRTDYSGLDSYQYRIVNLADATQVSASTLVNVTVSAVNDAPVPGTDSLTTLEGVPVTAPIAVLLGNDTDPDGNTLTFSAVASPSTRGGTVQISGSNIIYTPAANFSGVDVVYYTVTDGNGGSATGIITVSVTNVDNDPPVAVDDTISLSATTLFMQAAPGALANDYDPEGGPLTATLVSGPTRGTLAFNLDGSFTYLPNPGFLNGVDTFTYQVYDGTFVSNVATVSLIILIDSDSDGIPDDIDQDFDNDGFDNELELAVGSSPNDSSSTPFDGLPAGEPQNFLVSGLAVKLDFTRTGRDTIALKGTLPVTHGNVVAGQTVVVSVGGVIQAFRLNAQGNGLGVTNHSAKARLRGLRTFGDENIGFNVTFVGDYRLRLAANGLGNQDIRNVPKDIPVILLFNKTYYRQVKQVNYTARLGKSGQAR